MFVKRLIDKFLQSSLPSGLTSSSHSLRAEKLSISPNLCL